LLIEPPLQQLLRLGENMRSVEFVDIAGIEHSDFEALLCVDDDWP
jgi:hypothetical protein